MQKFWHIPVSHFSEKVRWAFDWKRVPHRRRVMPPGLHPLGGLLLTGGRMFTMPVLEMDGRRIGDSTAIIGALEERFPERSLYPSSLAERERALAYLDKVTVLAPKDERGFSVLYGIYHFTRDIAGLTRLEQRARAAGRS